MFRLAQSADKRVPPFATRFMGARTYSSYHSTSPSSSLNHCQSARISPLARKQAISKESIQESYHPPYIVLTRLSDSELE